MRPTERERVYPWVVVESGSTKPGPHGHFTMKTEHRFKTEADARSFAGDRKGMRVVTPQSDPTPSGLDCDEPTAGVGPD